jgi:beta-lactamase regulating signal transducer with metallopeptidase domain
MQTPVPSPGRDTLSVFIPYIWLVWIVVAVILFIRKITIYQSFANYIKAGRAPLESMATLERFGKLVEQANIKRMVGIYTNSLVSSPLLIGFFKPYIVLPTADISDADFTHTIMHELTHYKRGDMFYKWLVQLTICLHWFNPLVYLMGREINNACEFSCDEAVIKNLDSDGKREYGNTLLNALGFGGEYKNAISSVTLSENKKILEERLNMIKNFKKKSAFTTFCAVLLAALLSIGAGVIGVYATISDESMRAFDIAAFERRASAGSAWHNAIDYLEIDVEGIDLLILPRHDDRNRVSVSANSRNVRVGFGRNPGVRWWTYGSNSLSFSGGIVGGMGTGYADGDFMILYVPRNAERIFEYVNIRVRNGNVIMLGEDGGTNLTETLNVEVINGDAYIGANILVRGSTSVVINGIRTEAPDTVPREGYAQSIPVIENGFSFRLPNNVESGEAVLLGRMEMKPGMVYNFDVRFGINMGGVYVGFKAHYNGERFFTDIYEDDWLYILRDIRNGGKVAGDVNRHVYVYIIVPERSWVLGVWGSVVTKELAP